MMQGFMYQQVQHAFNLENILNRIHSKHLQILRLKQQKESRLTITKLLSINGQSILHLFGYYLAQKVGTSSFVEIGRMRTKRPWILDEQLMKYIKIFWPDCQKYERVVPILYSILKKAGAVYLTDIDQFVQVSKHSINQFAALLKQSLSPVRTEQLKRHIIAIAEKEDILDTGFIEKMIMDGIFKQYFKQKISAYPKELLGGEHQSKINYKQLISDKYLSAGKQINQFLLGHLARRVAQCIKKMGEIRKSQKKKTARRLQTKKIDKNKVRIGKVINQFIEENKPKKVDDPNQIKFVAKSILVDLIEVSVEISENEKPEQSSNQAIKKSVYITEPTLAEIEHEEKNIRQFQNLCFTQNTGLGIFVSGTQGQIIDPVHEKKGAIFHLRHSKILQSSPVICYQLTKDILYLLQENGLLFSWSIHEQVFQHQVETSLKKKQPLLHPNSSSRQKYFTIADGIIFVNCTHCQHGLIQFYKQEDLSYMGCITIRSEDYSIIPEYLIECQQLSKKVAKRIPIDLKIYNYQQYKKLLTETCNYNPKCGFSLGEMLCQYHSNGYFTIAQLQCVINYIQQYEKQVKMIFPEQIHQKISNKKIMQAQFTQNQIDYLLKLGYIAESSDREIERFVGKYVRYLDNSFDNRKERLLSLFEDYSLLELTDRFINMDEFLNWISPACLMKNQLAYIINHQLKFTPNGLINMTTLLKNQHYNRIIDNRRHRFLPENYKQQYLPPAIIQQMIPKPSLQIFLYTLKFPIRPCFYVGSLITGLILRKIDLSVYTSKQILINQCEKNGYAIVAAGRSLQLWSKDALCRYEQQEQIKASKQWVDLQSSKIVSCRILYQNNTLLTLTENCLKIWDLNQLFSYKEEKPVFTLKPGYRAIEKNLKSGATNFKKKIFFRGTPREIYSFQTPNSLTVVTLLSNNSDTIFIKSFFINKFHIVIDQRKQFQQIPTKLIRELQAIAQKRRRLPKNLPLTQKYSHQEEQVIAYIVNNFKYNLSASHSSRLFNSNRESLTKNLNRLSHDICNIFTTKNMFLMENLSINRLQRVFALYSISNKGLLNELLTKNILELYKEKQTNEYPLKRIFNDCLTLKQIRTVNRILYFLSLIQKYTRPFTEVSDANLIKLISTDKTRISQQKIMQLLPEDAPIETTLANKCIKYLNSFSKPVEISINLMKKYIPTRYRFLCPRYLKEIVKNRPSPQLNQFLSNRYEILPTGQQLTQILKALTHNSQYSTVNQFITDNSLYTFIAQEIAPNCPQIKLCNFSLIQHLFAYKKMTQQQAIYFTLQQSLAPSQRFSTVTQQQSHQLDANKIAYRINQNIISKKIRQLPKPFISFEYYKEKLYDEEYDREFFYNFLKGDKNKERTASSLVDFMLGMTRKGLSVKYGYSAMDEVINYGGTNKYPLMLKQIVDGLIQRIPKEDRIMPSIQFKSILMNFIDQESDYEQLTLRCTFSCCGLQSKIQQFFRAQNQPLQHRLSTQGMFVNVHHLIKYAQQFNPYISSANMIFDNAINSLNSLANNVSPENIKFTIPNYFWYKILEGDFRLLHISKFREILAHSINPIPLSTIDNIISSLYKYESTNIFLSDIPSNIFQFNPTLLGQILLMKYNRTDYEYKLTFVQHHVPSKQVIQLINSKILTAHLLSTKQQREIPEFLDYQTVMKMLRIDCIKPAISKYVNIFISKIAPQITSLLQYHLPQKQTLPIATVLQLLEQKQSEHTILQCIIRSLAQETDNALIISLNRILQNIEDIGKENSSKEKYEEYMKKMREKLANDVANPVQVFLKYGKRYNYPLCTISNSLKSDVIVEEHIRDYLKEDNEKYCWYLDYTPYAEATTFLDSVYPEYIHKTQLETIVQFFYDEVVNRIGIQPLLQKLGVSPTFPQFYFRLKSLSKAVAKYSTSHYLSLYKKICSLSPSNSIQQIGIMLTIQQSISISSKMDWISSLYDKQLIEQPLVECQQFFLETEYKLQKMKILTNCKIRYGEVSQREAMSKEFNEVVFDYLKKSLNYEKYLLNRYLGDDLSKIQQIYKGVVDRDEEGVAHLMDLNGVTNQYHKKVMKNYIFVHFQQIKTNAAMIQQELTEQNLKEIIAQIKQNCQNLNFPINYIPPPSEQPPINPQNWHKRLSTLLMQTKAYQKYSRQSSTTKFYNTYHTFLSYCNRNLTKIYNSPKYHKVILKKLQEFTHKNNISLTKIYGMFDLSHYENIVKYLPFCVVDADGIERADAVEKRLIDIDEKRKYVAEIFKKNRKTGMEIKYPITVSEFCELVVYQQQNTIQKAKTEQLYQQLDILGAGYVNLNDIDEFRGKIPDEHSPYVRISTYLNQISQEKDKSNTIKHYIKEPYYFAADQSTLFPQPPLPPPEHSIKHKIKEKLIKFQFPYKSSPKYALIDKQICLAILGQFGYQIDHTLVQFLTHYYEIKNYSKFNLAGILNWLFEFKGEVVINEENISQAKKYQNRVEQFTLKVQEIGGVHSYTEQILQTSSSQEFCTLSSQLIQMNPYPQNNLILSLGLKTPNKSFLASITETIVNYCYKEYRNWHTKSNQFCHLIKNMPQSEYSLIHKFYIAHREESMHWIYHQISTKGELTFFTLWQHIERKGITGYSRAEVQLLFDAIDINGDHSIQVNQFTKFWMAVQKIFIPITKTETPTLKISSLFDELRLQFLMLCLVDLDNYHTQELELPDLQKLLNVRNVDKIDRILRAVLYNKGQNYGSGAVDASLRMYRSKIKIMTDKLKNTKVQETDHQKHNHFLAGTEPHISPYLPNVFTKSNLIKFILAKYPNLGHRLIQQLQDSTKFQLPKIKQLFAKVRENKKVLTIEEKKIENFQVVKKIGHSLINEVSEFSRKNTIKAVSYQHEDGGASLARSLLNQQIAQIAESDMKEMQQIMMMLTKMQAVSLQIGYDIQQQIPEQIIDHIEINEHSLRREQRKYGQLLSEQPHILLDENQLTKSFAHYSIIRNISINLQFVQRVIQWHSTDYVCKSQNKVNLLKLVPLYNDPQISLMGISEETGLNNRFKITGYGSMSKQRDYAPMVTKQVLPTVNMDKVVHMMLGIVNQLYYCYIKYSVTGLLLFPQNLLISQQNHSQFKFDNFLTSLFLDLTSVTSSNSRVSNSLIMQNSSKSLSIQKTTFKEKSRIYVDGIDSILFTESLKSYPPQIDSCTYSQAIDVYQLAHIIYSMFYERIKPQVFDGQMNEMLGFREKNIGVGTDEESIWQCNSGLHQKMSQILSRPDVHAQLSEKEKMFWGLLYECSHYEWYMRPKLYQVRQFLLNYLKDFVTDTITQFNPHGSNNTLSLNIFIEQSTSQQILINMHGQNYEEANRLLQLQGSLKGWSLKQIIEFRQCFPTVLTQSPQQLPNLFKNFNRLLARILQFEPQILTEIDNARQFMDNIVEYLFTPTADNYALCMLAISAYKDTLSCKEIQGYLLWCDENWKIDEYIINNKLQQVNMLDRLQKLHKNSLYYHDLTTLAECRTVLATPPQNNKTSTSQKVAISFIHSSLISNNINKVYALYQSKIIKTIYLSLNLSQKTSTATDQQQSHILSIFQKISQCLNPTKHLNRFKAVNEVYKIMMVIFNAFDENRQKSSKNMKSSFLGSSKRSLKGSNTESGLKQNKSIKMKSSHLSQSNQEELTQSIVMSPIRTLLNTQNTFAKTPHRNSQPVPQESSSSNISMLQFMNNYYTLGGEECREVIMKKICIEQFCTLPALLFLLNLHPDTLSTKHKSILTKIFMNLSFNKKIEKMLKSSTTDSYISKIRQGYLTKNKQILHGIVQSIEENLTAHQESVTLCQLSTQQYSREHYSQAVIDHLRFYGWFMSHYVISSDIPFRYKVNTHQYLLGFLSRAQKICEQEIQSVQTNQNALQIVKMVVKAHRVMFDLWTQQPAHIDYISATIRFLLKTLQQIYSQQQLYIQNKAHASITPEILHILNRLWIRKQSQTHNLIRIAIDNGYVHFYCRIVKKQHSLLLKFIEKNVENIHLIENYPVEAEFRLINFYNLLVSTEHEQSVYEHRVEIQQILLSNHFIKYIFDAMFKSEVIMDLRFFRASNIEIVPYRFCNPLKSQAITMIGFVLNAPSQLALKNQFINHLIPNLLQQAQILSSWNSLISLQRTNQMDEKAMMRVIQSFWLLANLSENEDTRLKYQIMNLQINQIVLELVSYNEQLRKFFPKFTQTMETFYNSRNS